MEIYLTCIECIYTFCQKHQVVGPSGAYEISFDEILFWKYLEFVPIILCNYKELKMAKFFKFIASSFPNSQCVLVTTAEQKFKID